MAFYEKLGFTKLGDYSADVQGCTMKSGDAALFLFETRRVGPAAVQRDQTLAQNPAGIDHISFLVSDIDTFYADLKAAGVTFAGEPADQDWGARLVGLTDPDGNNLYFLEYL